MSRIRPSDIPTKIVRGPEGERVRMKIVRADSATLPDDLLAAFRSNVRSIRDERRRKSHNAPDTA